MITLYNFQSEIQFGRVEVSPSCITLKKNSRKFIVAIPLRNPWRKGFLLKLA